MRRLPETPLFLQTLGLVIVTLLAAQLAAILVIFNLPPPQPQVYSVDDVVAAIRGIDAPPSHGGGALVVRRAPRPPTTQTIGHRRVGFRNAVAQALGVDPDSVVVAERGARIVVVNGQSRGAPRPPRRFGGPPGGLLAPHEEPLLLDFFQLGVRQGDGSWLVVSPKTTFGVDPWQARLLLVSALAALVAAPVAWAFSRRLAAPIAALAVGARRLGRDPQAPPLEVRGSREVAAAVDAFNEMQERLRRYVDDRTAMIGAIAHDLRTPLTRLRFRIESAPEDMRQRLAADIDQMDAMISAALVFVRDATLPRRREPVEIASMVEIIIDEAAETGADAAIERMCDAVVDGDPLALRRLVTNLVDNGLKYGGRVRARVGVQEDMAIIEIDDDGPGIPPPQLDRVFDPFYRLEGSRSRDTGGMGLGLAVVRAVARGHGGDVVLANRDGGGLRARVSLPLSLEPGGPAP